MKLLIVLSVAFVLLVSCGGSSEKTNTMDKSPLPEKTAILDAADDLSSHPGESLYKQHCLVCHQADGNGVPGMFPPLHDTEWVNGDNATLISIVLHGMDEEIEVNGEIYHTIMAPLPHLSNQEVADVLNYVRKRFGSAPADITVAEVAGVRAEG
ncbi:MAG: cytochrome c [Bacteroidales bacterium]|nr:cytochrome c [Bacteroidales bacterium]MDT8429904.1 cytochrome c [Bacteroidales bacterium]